jgi:hypothetical protein
MVLAVFGFPHGVNVDFGEEGAIVAQQYVEQRIDGEARMRLPKRIGWSMFKRALLCIGSARPGAVRGVNKAPTLRLTECLDSFRTIHVLEVLTSAPSDDRA